MIVAIIVCDRFPLPRTSIMIFFNEMGWGGCDGIELEKLNISDHGIGWETMETRC